MEDQPYVYEIFIATSLERLWKALTSTEDTKKYFVTLGAHSDWKEGSIVEFRKNNGELDGKGEILESNPYGKLKYSWNDVGDELAPSIITYELEKVENEDVVKLTLTHDKLMGRAYKFWPIVLSEMKTLIESGQPIFSWSKKNSS
ncbi:hypothetical protein E3U55_16020 [Filobacillus milosensis]|uniref:Activator of Hsp90 ATPase homologue 1/2-like C-terminal domain-containing protein n=1 Tax=Filobacillus milosensis TaxID=94137 RepID=A0A4Y8IEN1_9BACI|nr:SRPBCC domain-containing protein [Filobacillus milosensis]TFB13478.1 hypothetical protein E3U55_16020 [Filobacillus milosensis]